MIRRGKPRRRRHYVGCEGEEPSTSRLRRCSIQATACPSEPRLSALQRHRCEARRRGHSVRASDEDRGWSLDLDRISASVTPRTRAIVIGNPNNPTGALYHRATLEGLLAVARAHRLVVLSDEIYEKLTYDKPHVATASLADDVPVVTFGGLSKGYLACGWRTGWMVFCNASQMTDYRAGVFRLADARLSSPLPPQFAIRAALDGSQEHLPTVRAKLVARRDLVVERIRAIGGMSVVEPQGAFYAMPRVCLPGVVDDEAFVLELLRATGVSVGPRERIRRTCRDTTFSDRAPTTSRSSVGCPRSHRRIREVALAQRVSDASPWPVLSRRRARAHG